MTTKPQFRTGPHMGIPYEQALAVGLSSAMKGREAYEAYLATVRVSTPSERLLRGTTPTFAIVDDILDPGLKPFPAALDYTSLEERVAVMTACYGAQVDPMHLARFAMNNQPVPTTGRHMDPRERACWWSFNFLTEPLEFTEEELTRDFAAEGVGAIRRLQGKIRNLENAMAAEKAHQEHRKGARRG